MPTGNRIAWGALIAATATVGLAQPLVPLADDVSKPLLPTGILRYDVHIDGQLMYLWEAGDAQHVIHVVGDFAMTVGGRKLHARQAIVWMTSRRHDTIDYRQFEVFLFRDARVLEPAGTITEGPILFVTVSSMGEVSVSADRRTFASSAETAVYRDASAVRDAVRRGLPGAPETVPVTRITSPADESKKKPAPEFAYAAENTSFTTLADGRRIITCTGRVNVFRGDSGDGNTLELRADAAVVFLRAEDASSDEIAPKLQAREEQVEALAGAGVDAIYLEGDIRMVFGDRTIRAKRLYYDLLHDRALILDAVFFTVIPDRNLPLYLRAETIRQLSDGEFSAENASVTTSEFHTPHYHIGAQRVELIDRTPRSLAGQRVGIARGSFKLHNATFNLYNTPVFYWPTAGGDVRVGESSLRGVSIGASGDFGLSIETEWDLFNLLSLERPEGFTAELHMDYFDERGPATGLDVNYVTDDYFGLFRGYLIEDSGEDNLGRFRDNQPDRTTRGRTTWRHRHYLPDDWELTLELSYISDRGFLEEYFEHEFDEGKDQETLVYAKKQRDNWAFTALGQVRLNDFFTQTERLPDFGFHIVGQPLGDAVTWFSENRVGVVRYRAAEKEFFLLLRQGSDGPSSGSTARVDTRQEFELPLDVGPVRLVPFVSLRGTAWDDSPDDGGLARGFATYGVRGSMFLSRVYADFESDLLDVHGLRHVIKPQIVAFASHSNRDSDELFPFDRRIEGIDDFSGVALGVRQRWQTKRGPIDGRRSVDWITLDVELGLFSDSRSADRTYGFTSFTRPETSVSRNYVSADFIWRINDATALLSEMNYDVNDGEVDLFNVSLAVERTPRFSYLFGYRFIEETNSNLMGFGMNYKIDRKHMIAFREEFDLARGETLDFSIGYVRKYPRWYVALTFDLDEAEDNAGVSISVWPEGLPRATLGSRRFTGLATSTALRAR